MISTKIVENDSSSCPKTCLVLFYFDRILGPEKYFESGLLSLNDSIENQLTYYMTLKTGKYSIQIENVRAIILAFEIASSWGRGNSELLELVFLYNCDPIFCDAFVKSINQDMDRLMETLKNNAESFKALYLSDNEKRKKFREQIENESQIIKKSIKSLSDQIITKIETNSWNEETLEQEFQIPQDYLSLETSIQKLLSNEH